MRLDENYLREMELWPLFELRGRIANSSPVAKQEAPATAETYSPPSIVARPTALPARAREIVIAEQNDEIAIVRICL